VFAVLDDADIDKAAKAGAQARVSNAGQVCTAAKRFIIHEKVADEFLKKFTEHFKALKIGDPLDKSTTLGPLSSAEAVKTLSKQVDDAVKHGAKLHFGGKKVADNPGNFFEPTVIDGVMPGMEVFSDELFGPVASISKADDADHALKLANDTRYGLSSAVLTQDLQMAMKFALGLEAGMVHINSSTIHDEPHIPFGGVKDSGMAREGGQWSMEEMTELKWITIQQGQRHYPF